MGTAYLLVPKLRNGGYIPFFLTVRKRSEAAMIQVIQEAYIQGVSTRRMEKLAQSLGIDSMSRSYVSEIAKGLNEQTEAFHSRSLMGHEYPVIWADALKEFLSASWQRYKVHFMRNILARAPQRDKDAFAGNSKKYGWCRMKRRRGIERKHS